VELLDRELNLILFKAISTLIKCEIIISLIGYVAILIISIFYILTWVNPFNYK